MAPTQHCWSMDETGLVQGHFWRDCQKHSRRSRGGGQISSAFTQVRIASTFHTGAHCSPLFNYAISDITGKQQLCLLVSWSRNTAQRSWHLIFKEGSNTNGPCSMTFACLFFYTCVPFTSSNLLVVKWNGISLRSHTVPCLQCPSPETLVYRHL